MDKYNLLALPVLDADGKIAGVIRINDILDIILPRRIKEQRISKVKYRMKTKRNGKEKKEAKK